MNDAHLNRQHRLLYSLRGPEWAFAIPQGDFDALEEVMRLCSEFWNGRGSLLIPVSKAGRIPDVIDLMLRVRPVDDCYLHPSLGERAQTAVRERVGGAVPLYDEFSRWELHPLLMAPVIEDEHAKPSVFIPRFESAHLRRVALATCGHWDEEDMPHWRARFGVAELGGDAAHRALVEGQIGPFASSPLQLSALNMKVIEQRGPQDWPYLVILDRATFTELVNFWNFRARSLMHGQRGAPVLGLPREALAFPEHFAAIARWGASPDWQQRTPDFLVAANEAVSEEVDAALSAIGLDRDRGDTLRTATGDRTEERERPTYRYQRPLISERFERGIHAFTLVAFVNGKSTLSLTPPEGFSVRSGHHVRLAFRNLPLPFPPTEATAQRILQHGFVSGGVAVLTDAVDRWNFDVRLPAAWDALQDWAGAAGYTPRLSQAGRYATALLQRLGDLDRLHVLADELRVQVLSLLTPESRLRLTQRLTAAVAEKREADERELAEELARQIADIGLFLEVEARAAEALGSELGMPRPRILEALGPLVQASLIQRGQTTNCPRCNYTAFVGLDDLTELVTCRACRQQYVLPVAEASGRREPAVTYQLDGLMARVMDQGLLPVMLALRALMPPDEVRDMFFAWPGLEFVRSDDITEVDLLTSDGDNVIVTEVKTSAAGLDREQLDGLLELSEALDAKPCIAALEGTFDAELAELVQLAGGRVLHRSALLG